MAFSRLLTDLTPDTIRSFAPNNKEKLSRNKKRSGWSVFMSRFIVELNELKISEKKEILSNEGIRRSSSFQIDDRFRNKFAMGSQRGIPRRRIYDEESGRGTNAEVS